MDETSLEEDFMMVGGYLQRTTIQSAVTGQQTCCTGKVNTREAGPITGKKKNCPAAVKTPNVQCMVPFQRCQIKSE